MQGLSPRGYAKQSGLDVQRLYHWNRRLKQLGFVGDAEAVSFAAVQVQASPSLTGVHRLHFPNGLVLEWNGDADLAAVAQLVQLSPAQR